MNHHKVEGGNLASSLQKCANYPYEYSFCHQASISAYFTN